MVITSPLLTDLYQLTMAAGYFELGIAERDAVFNLFYRKNPFKGNYAVCCGLANVMDYLAHYQFSEEELDYLTTLTGADGKNLFSAPFLEYLRELEFQCHIDAMPEGTIAFTNEPLMRVTGPLLQCQLIETALVNLINYSSLIATKAARVCQAAQGDEVIEFGMRRAHGPNGAMMATRAAFIGGCQSSSNTLAGMVYDIPVKGTQAHSWIMAADNELTAFEQYAKVMPNNVMLLVDTYNTEQGIKNAIKVGRQLRERGHDLLGIRLDSGDLEKLSKLSRELLNDAGFENTKIVASGDLEEHRITELKHNNSPIDIWGVGTKMITAYDQPSLDAAYKLGAIKDEYGNWQYKIKFSETGVKTSNPGLQQVRRYYKQQYFLQDMLYDIEMNNVPDLIEDADASEDLLVPIFRAGKCVYKQPSLTQIQHLCRSQVRDFLASHVKDYSMVLEPKLAGVKDELFEHAPK